MAKLQDKFVEKPISRRRRAVAARQVCPTYPAEVIANDVGAELDPRRFGQASSSTVELVRLARENVNALKQSSATKLYIRSAAALLGYSSTPPRLNLDDALLADGFGVGRLLGDLLADLEVKYSPALSGFANAKVVHVDEGDISQSPTPREVNWRCRPQPPFTSMDLWRVCYPTVVFTKPTEVRWSQPFPNVDLPRHLRITRAVGALPLRTRDGLEAATLVWAGDGVVVEQARRFDYQAKRAVTVSAEHRPPLLQRLFQRAGPRVILRRLPISECELDEGGRP